MKHIIILLVIFIIPILVFADESDVKIFEAVEQSVVYIEASVFLNKSDFNNQEIIKKIEKEYKSNILDSYLPIQTGSGFFITNNGYILTNNHVTFIKNENIAKIEVYNGLFYNFLSKIPIELLNDKEYKRVKSNIRTAIENSKIYYRVLVNNKKYYICDIINSDNELDITLLKIKEKQNFKPVLMGNSNLIKVGEKAIAIGYPFATYFFEIIKDLNPTMTLGTISAIRTDNWGIQHTASINLGNSGGPLLNKNGEVIGINVGAFSNTNAMFFSIPINKVKSWLNDTNLGSIIYQNKNDCKKIYLYRNIRIEYKEINKNIRVELPEGYKIFVNGKYKGNTPLDIKGLPEGIVTIRVESNIAYSEQKFNVNKSDENFYIHKPIMNKYQGKLIINTNPKGAKIFIDDIEIGVSPYSLNNILIGTHKIKIMLEGYLPINKEINIKKNETMKIKENLLKGIKITFKEMLPEDIIIKFKNKDNEYIFKYNNFIMLPPDKYELELSSKEIKTKSYNLDLSKSDDVELDLKLDFVKSKLKLNNLKKESRVFVNNIDVTDTIIDNILYLKLGLHRIKILTENYYNIIENIRIEKDKDSVLYLTYISKKVNSISLYRARNALLGVGIPTLSVGGVLLAIGGAGTGFTALIYPEGSLLYNFESVVRQRIAFFAILGVGGGVTTCGLIMAIVSIPVHFYAKKLEDSDVSFLMDFNGSNIFIGLNIKL